MSPVTIHTTLLTHNGEDEKSILEKLSQWVTSQGWTIEEEESGRPSKRTKKKTHSQQTITNDSLQSIIDASLTGISYYRPLYNEVNKLVDFQWVLQNRKAKEYGGNRSLIGKRWAEEYPCIKETCILDSMIAVVETGQVQDSEFKYSYDGNDRWFRLTGVKLGEGLVILSEDITKQKIAEQKLLRLKDEVTQHATDKYYSIFNSIDEGFCIIEVLFDETGKPYDYRFLEANASFEKQTGLLNAVGKTMKELAPAHEEHWFQIYGRIAQSGEPARFENPANTLGYCYDVYAFRISAPEEHQVAILFNDITDRKRLERERTRVNELLQATFDNSPQIIQLFKAIRDEQTGDIVDFEWLMTNKRWNELYGGMAGKRLLTQNPAVIETELFDDFKRVTETGVPITQEHYYAYEQFDGWFLQTVAKVEDGFLLSTLDITERKRQEQRQDYLLQLSDVLCSTADPIAIEEKVTSVAMSYFGADRCYYCTIEGDDAVIRRDARKEGLSSVAGRYPLSSFNLFNQVIKGGVPFVVNDAHTTAILDESLRALCLQLQVISFVDVPVVKKGQAAGILCLVQSTPRAWTGFEKTLAVETAERTWAAIERARVEEVLQKSEERYRRLFNSIDEGFHVIELIYDDKGKAVDYRFLETNQSFERHTGWQNAKGKVGSEIAPSTEEYWLKAYEDVARTGEPLRFESYNEFTKRWYSAFAFRASPQNNEQVVVLFADITDRKHAEEELRENEERQRQLLSTYAQAIWETDAEGVVVTDSPSWRAYTGQTFEEWIGYGWVNAIHLDDREYAERQWREAVVGKKNVNAELRLQRASGGYHWTNVIATPLLDKAGQILKWVGMNINIQERKQAEQELKSFATTWEEKVLQRTQELKESTALLEASANTSPLGMVVVKSIRNEKNDIIDFQYLWLNAVSQEMAGENVIGAGMLQKYPHIKEIGLFDAYVKAVEQNTRTDFEEYYLPAGRWFRWLAVKLNDGLFISVEEITSRKNAELKIQEQAHFIEQVISNVPDTVLIFDLAEQRNVFANPEVEVLLGYTPAEMQAFGAGVIQRIVYPDDWNIQSGLLAALTTLEDGEIQESEYRIQHKNGSLRWVQTRRTVFKRTKEGLAEQIIAILHDITQLKNSEQELQDEHYFLEQVTDKTPHLIYVFDLEEQRFTYINKRVNELIGQTEEYIYAMGPHLFQAILHPEDLPTRISYMNDMTTLKEGEVREIEFRIWVANGFRYFRTKDSIFKKENGVVKQVIGIGEDITVEKILQEQAQKGKGHIGLN